jgi:hypothetical protein
VLAPVPGLTAREKLTAVVSKVRRVHRAMLSLSEA